MSKIIQLDEQLANMIAAGEVVERPSGIIKELLENSIDAQATQISVEVVNGGLDLIKVTDNGEGMDSADLVMAFKRHSTSKIKKPNDLHSISTLGFRGEALPSIASVSKVLMTSNQHQIEVDNGKMSEVIPMASNQGTTIEVSQLFYKTPARLKHLKSPQYEQTRNLGLVQNMALGYPNIAFSYYNNEQLLFKTSGKGDLREVFFEIYGSQYARDSVFFKGQNNDFKISGLYSKPHHHRANNFQMNLFLNKRLIRYYQINQTLLREFRRYMPVDRFPLLVLNIETDVQLVDVNVHPSKLEVRLSKEQELLGLIERVIHESLKEEMGSKEISKHTFEKPMVISIFDEVVTQEPVKTYTYEKQPITQEIIKEEPIRVEEVVIKPAISPISVIGQHHGSFILAQDENSLYIFDQHASMERIRYEKVVQQINENQFVQQPLLFPLVFENRALSLEHPEEILEHLKTFGLELELFSDKDLILRSIPSWLGKVDPFTYVNLLLDEPSHTLESINHKALATKACHQSVRFNESYSNMQLQKIVDDLLQCEQPYHCPHGRATFIKANASDLLKEFSR